MTSFKTLKTSAAKTVLLSFVFLSLAACGPSIKEAQQAKDDHQEHSHDEKENHGSDYAEESTNSNYTSMAAEHHNQVEDEAEPARTEALTVIDEMTSSTETSTDAQVASSDTESSQDSQEMPSSDSGDNDMMVMALQSSNVALLDRISSLENQISQLSSTVEQSEKAKAAETNAELSAKLDTLSERLGASADLRESFQSSVKDAEKTINETANKADTLTEKVSAAVESVDGLTSNDNQNSADNQGSTKASSSVTNSESSDQSGTKTNTTSQ